MARVLVGALLYETLNEKPAKYFFAGIIDTGCGPGERAFLSGDEVEFTTLSGGKIRIRVTEHHRLDGFESCFTFRGRGVVIGEGAREVEVAGFYNTYQRKGHLTVYD